MYLRLNLVQALRGVAALIVVIHHISASSNEYFNIFILNNFFKQGWNGVDFFFVLSGFIMVYIHFADLKNRANVYLFYLKRILRIYPTYWILASVSLVFFWLTGKISNQEWDYMYLLNSYLLLPSHKAPFLGVAWSLIYEVFFYFIFGLGLLCGLRIMKTLIPLWLIVVLTVNIFKIDPLYNLFFFKGYIVEFLFGSIIGYVYHIYFIKINKYGNSIIYFGLFLFSMIWIISLYTNIGSKSAIESRIIYGLASSLIILGAAVIDRNKPINVGKWWLLMGDSSYSIYLIHPLVLAFVYKASTSGFLQINISSLNAYAIAILAFIFSTFSGIIFHILIEKKLLKFFNRLFYSRNEKEVSVAKMTYN